MNHLRGKKKRHADTLHGELRGNSLDDFRNFTFSTVLRLRTFRFHAGPALIAKCMQNWLPNQDSNLDKLNQNQLCYHYTIGHLKSSLPLSSAHLVR